MCKPTFTEVRVSCYQRPASMLGIGRRKSPLKALMLTVFSVDVAFDEGGTGGSERHRPEIGSWLMPLWMVHLRFSMSDGPP